MTYRLILVKYVKNSFGVSAEEVRRLSNQRQFGKDMMKKGTSESRTRSDGRPCAGCGKFIQSGLYCSACLEKFRDKAKMQGRRIEAMKRNDLKKVAENRNDVVILIVNSDERNLNITKIVLDRGLPGYKILTANNTLTAISFLVGHGVNMVILDADYNGIDILRRIREDERFRELPVMMMSASTQRELVAEVFSLGVQDYITKPCSPRDLVDRVSKMIEGSSASVAERTAEIRTKTSFNILLIEDDIFDLRQERDILKNRLPCEVTTVQSATDGMRALENQDVDLVLVSLDMPFVSGLDFLSTVKNNNQLKNIPVIIMTDTRNFSVISEIKRSAAAGYVKKPNFSEDDLAVIESKLLRRR